MYFCFIYFSYAVRRVLNHLFVVECFGQKIKYIHLDRFGGKIIRYKAKTMVNSQNGNGFRYKLQNPPNVKRSIRIYSPQNDEHQTNDEPGAIEIINTRFLNVDKFASIQSRK